MPTSLFETLQSAGLLRDVSEEQLVVKVTELAADLGCDDDDPFVLICLLDEHYGFDTGLQQEMTARCLRDRVLVFNELHETPREPFLARVGAFCTALGVSLPALAGAPDPEDPDLPFETVDDLADALGAALQTTNLSVFVVGIDTTAAVMVRERAPAALIALLEAPAATPDPVVAAKPWWKFWD